MNNWAMPTRLPRLPGVPIAPAHTHILSLRTTSDTHNGMVYHHTHSSHRIGICMTTLQADMVPRDKQAEPQCSYMGDGCMPTPSCPLNYLRGKVWMEESSPEAVLRMAFNSVPTRGCTHAPKIASPSATSPSRPAHPIPHLRF